MSYYLSGDAANGKNGECLGDRIVASPKDATALNDLRASGCVELGVDPVGGGVIFCCGSKLPEKGDEVVGCGVGAVEVKAQTKLLPFLQAAGCGKHPQYTNMLCCPAGAEKAATDAYAASLFKNGNGNGKNGGLTLEEQYLLQKEADVRAAAEAEALKRQVEAAALYNAYWSNGNGNGVLVEDAVAPLPPVEPGEIVIEEQLLEPSLVQRGVDFMKAHPFVTAGLLLGGVWAVRKVW
ncbi:MAG: hypothetical protein ABIK85_04055 [Candidatus Eisenbacteria bacterium]